MSLPSPNLDDRRYQDIVQEAFQLIQRRCPEWTDFNPSDPGVTLVELMAWMTELTLYRLNRVPEKHYLKFLDLLGISLKVATPAKAWVHFTLSKSIKEEKVGDVVAGTELIAKNIREEEIPFITTDHLNLTTANLCKLISVYGDQWCDHTRPGDQSTVVAPPISFGEKGVALFENLTPQQLMLYMGTDDLGAWSAQAKLTIYVEIINAARTGVQIEWEIYIQDQWQPVVPAQDTIRGARMNGTLVFDPIPLMDPVQVNDQMAYWIRAKLLAQSGQESPKFSKFQVALEIKEECGVPIEKSVLNAERESAEQEIPLPAFQEMDISKEFYPFGRHPQTGDIWYVNSSLLNRNGSTFMMDVRLAEQYTATASEDLGDLEILWEYFGLNGEWHELGVSTPQEGRREGGSQWVQDGTRALTKEGTITMTFPTDTKQVTVLGTLGSFVRAKIVRGDFGGKHPNPPCVASVRVRFAEHAKDWSYLVAQRGNELKSLLPKGEQPDQTIEPFETENHTSPTIYIALDQLPANKTQRFYISIQAGKNPPEGRVSWTYQTAEGWKPLEITLDNTEDFSQSGAIEYIAPQDWIRDHRFGLKDEKGKQEWLGYWIRIQWMDWSHRTFPILQGIWCNMVETIQVKALSDETLYEGNGTAFQAIQLDHGPLQPGLQVWVQKDGEESPAPFQPFSGQTSRRSNNPSRGENTNQNRDLWTPVENFLFSTSADRHYQLDENRGIITFGDGIRGQIPTPGPGTIMVCGYRVTQGANGNVEKGTIITMTISNPKIDSVINPEAARGGTEGETLEEAKLRAPQMLTNRNRAVTLEDFESLALQASRGVGKAKALSVDSGVQVTIIPSSPDPKPQPSKQLLTTVKEFLDLRRVMTVPLRVTGPSYTDVHVDVKIVLKPTGKPEEGTIHQSILAHIEGMWHPIFGNDDGGGWPIGRPVHVSELYHLIEQRPEVDYVAQLTMWSGNLKRKLDRIVVGQDGFPGLGQFTLEIVQG